MQVVKVKIHSIRKRQRRNGNIYEWVEKRAHISKKFADVKEAYLVTPELFGILVKKAWNKLSNLERNLILEGLGGEMKE